MKRPLLRISGLARQVSLKKTLVAALLLCTLIPLALIGTISYFALYQVQRDRISDGIQKNLASVRVGLENAIDDLDYASKQLAYDGRVGDKVISYLTVQDVASRYGYGQEIDKYITLISFTNPDLGIMFYYFPGTGEPLFENYQVKDDFSLSELPVFVRQKGFTIYGPHATAYKRGSNTVFAISRKLDTDQADCYIYVELSQARFEKLLYTRQYGLNVSHLLLDENGSVAYGSGDAGQAFSAGATPPEAAGGLAASRGYYWFAESSSQGWRIMAAVKETEYNRILYDWFARFALITALALAISLALALAVWKMVYRPIQYLNKHIGLIADSNFDSDIRLTKVREFDDLLEHFQHMRRTIAFLLAEVERKEKLKRRVEVEKLLYQINPHFLYNTLNTVQWLARMNGQDQIDRFVALLTKVLQYNLGKEGSTVSVAQEVEALDNYMRLQQMRSDDQLDAQITVDPQTLSIRLPRFILQPLVENAIHHGLRNDRGSIRVNVWQQGEALLVSVADDGAGLEHAEVQRMMAEEAGDRTGMGIGLSYVRRMMELHYGESASLTVRSEPGQGTTFLLTISAAGPG